MMDNEELKRQFNILKNNLIENLAVYHERVTLLVQLTKFDIKDNGVQFKAKVIKPLNKSHAEQNRLYNHMLIKGTISFSISYKFGVDDKNSILLNKKIAGPYCPFILWLDPELSMFVKDNEDAVTKQIPEFILSGKDWKNLLANK